MPTRREPTGRPTARAALILVCATILSGVTPPSGAVGAGAATDPPPQVAARTVAETRAAGPARATPPAATPRPPTARPGRPPAPTGCVNTPRGWQAAERATTAGRTALPIANHTRFAGPATAYVDEPVARCGRPIDIHIGSTRSRQVRVEILRVGDYRGAPARVVWRSGAIRVPARALTPPKGEWTASTTWPATLRVTPSNRWRPGLHLIRTTPLDDPRHPSWQPVWLAVSGPRPPLVVVASDLTALAYNRYGGRSLYFGPGRDRTEQSATRAYHAWARRPVSEQGLTHVLSMEVPLARLLDRLGVSADWTTDSELDADPALLRRYTGVVLPGHSEYWTSAMYDGVEKAVAGGVNVANLGANSFYWQARTTRDARGRLTAMTLYREKDLDPVTDRRLTTVRWATPLLDRDPARLLGVRTTAIGFRSSPVVVDPPSWFLAGTRLRPGAVLVSGAGNEGDGVIARVSPANTQVLLASTSAKGARVTTTYRSTPSGAALFSAGTTYWTCLAVDACGSQSAPPATRTALTALTRNVLTAAATPRFGHAHPSSGPTP